MNSAKQLLTRREKEILQLVLEEQTSAEISEQLGLSLQTINTHRKNILKKTRSRSLIGLIKFAIKARMLKDFFYREGPRSPIAKKR